MRFQIKITLSKWEFHWITLVQSLFLNLHRVLHRVVTGKTGRGNIIYLSRASGEKSQYKIKQNTYSCINSVDLKPLAKICFNKLQTWLIHEWKIAKTSQLNWDLKNIAKEASVKAFQHCCKKITWKCPCSYQKFSLTIFPLFYFYLILSLK